MSMETDKPTESFLLLEVAERLPPNTYVVVVDTYRQSLVEQRRAALLQANALGRLLNLPDVCPCCGKRKE